MSDRYQTLIPRPRHASRTTGTVELDADTRLHPRPGAEGATEAVRLLLAPLRLPLAPATESAPNTITVGLDHGIGGPETYRLTVTPEGVEIVGADLDGVRHATQGLRQLLPDDAWRATRRPGVTWIVPCGEIVDAPALSWRGGMLDVSRHFAPKHELLRYVDLFAMHRLNRLHLHLTDDQGWRIESRRHPRINEVASHRPYTQAGRHRSPDQHDGTPHGGFYTLADLAEVTTYAAERGITVVPEVDLPGHSSALLAAFPEYGIGTHTVLPQWGISSGVLKPLPATVRFITELLEELIDAVPAPFIHLGGDECVLSDWAADPEIMAYLTDIGGSKLVDLHGHFLRELATALAKQGRRAVVWDEAFVTGGLLSDTLVTAWRGDSVGRRVAAAGYDLIRCPVWPTYFDYDQSTDGNEPLSIGGPIPAEAVAAFAPVPAGWSAEEGARVIGTQFQAWSEYIPHGRHRDYMCFPRASVLADVAWRGEPVADSPRFDLGAYLSPHLARLDAAGVEYRPLDGPHPWQAGGTSHRRHIPGPPMEAIRNHIDKISESGENEAATTS